MSTITRLNVTDDVLRDVVAFCRAEYPREACGFIVGQGMIGRRVVPMTNVHRQPENHYRMIDEEILKVYAEADAAGEEVVAAYHSHPNSAPIMSSGSDGADVESAADTDIAYLIVSTRNPERPTARAWRVATPFIGVKVAEEIQLHSSPTGGPLTPSGPVLPWALSVGNYVQITYRRARGEGDIVLLATVTGTADENVLLRPRLKSNVSTLPLERILKVEVITESEVAKVVRRQAIACLRHAAAALSSGDVNLVEQLIAVPAAAFPASIETSVRE